MKIITIGIFIDNAFDATICTHFTSGSYEINTLRHIATEDAKKKLNGKRWKVQIQETYSYYITTKVL